MYSGGQQLSPPPQASGEGRGPLVTQPIGVDSSQLQARLYGTSEIHTSTRPQLKVVRKKHRREQVCLTLFIRDRLFVAFLAHEFLFCSCFFKISAAAEVVVIMH